MSSIYILVIISKFMPELNQLIGGSGMAVLLGIGLFILGVWPDLGFSGIEKTILIVVGILSFLLGLRFSRS